MQPHLSNIRGSSPRVLQEKRQRGRHLRESVEWRNHLFDQVIY
jgi:hypothetical protein